VRGRGLLCSRELTRAAFSVMLMNVIAAPFRRCRGASGSSVRSANISSGSGLDMHHLMNAGDDDDEDLMQL
jgi:hypothetical protein